MITPSRAALNDPIPLDGLEGVDAESSEDAGDGGGCFAASKSEGVGETKP